MEKTDESTGTSEEVVEQSEPPKRRDNVEHGQNDIKEGDPTNQPTSYAGALAKTITTDTQAVADEMGFARKPNVSGLKTPPAASMGDPLLGKVANSPMNDTRFIPRQRPNRAVKGRKQYKEQPKVISRKGNAKKKKPKGNGPCGILKNQDSDQQTAADI